MTKTLYAIRLKSSKVFFKFEQLFEDGYGKYRPSVNNDDINYSEELPSFFREKIFPIQKLESNNYPYITYTEQDIEWVEFKLEWS